MEGAPRGSEPGARPWTGARRSQRGLQGALCREAGQGLGFLGGPRADIPRGARRRPGWGRGLGGLGAPRAGVAAVLEGTPAPGAAPAGRPAEAAGRAREAGALPEGVAQRGVEGQRPGRAGRPGGHRGGPGAPAAGEAGVRHGLAAKLVQGPPWVRGQGSAGRCVLLALSWGDWGVLGDAFRVTVGRVEQQHRWTGFSRGPVKIKGHLEARGPLTSRKPAPGAPAASFPWHQFPVGTVLLYLPGSVHRTSWCWSKSAIQTSRQPCARERGSLVCGWVWGGEREAGGKTPVPPSLRPIYIYPFPVSAFCTSRSKDTDL